MKQVFHFIQNQANSFAVSALWQVLKVSKSAFYDYLKATKEKPPEPLAKEVKEVFWQHRRCYESRRLHAQLRAEGKVIGRHKVRRWRKENGLKKDKS